MSSIRPLREAALAALILCAATMAARAEDSDLESAVRWFNGIDVDRDGAMTAEEMSSVRGKRFDRMDGDADGALTLEEYLFGIPRELEREIERRTRRFALMDADGDGLATKAEYLAFGDQVLATADLDGDGRVTLEEFVAVTVPQAGE